MSKPNGSLSILKGDLLNLAADGAFGAILQGCNCFHGSDGGIAGQVWSRFPEAYHGKVLDHVDGDWSIFGTYSAHMITQEDTFDKKNPLPDYLRDYLTPAKVTHDLPVPFYVINAYTQYQGGANFYMAAFIKILKKLNVNMKGMVIGIPKVGCGIGGGNWEEVEEVLLTHAPDINWRVVIWK